MIHLYFGNGVLAARMQANLSQQAVADALGMPRSYLSFIENGRTLADWGTVLRLAKILECTPGDLYKPALLKAIQEASIGGKYEPQEPDAGA